MKVRNTFAAIGLFAAFYILLYPFFYKEVFSLYMLWGLKLLLLFVIPIALAISFFENDRFVLFFIMSAVLLAVLGIGNYLLGLLGLHVKYHWLIILPLNYVIAISLIHYHKKKPEWFENK